MVDSAIRKWVSIVLVNGFPSYPRTHPGGLVNPRDMKMSSGMKDNMKCLGHHPYVLACCVLAFCPLMLLVLGHHGVSSNIQINTSR